LSEGVFYLSRFVTFEHVTRFSELQPCCLLSPQYACPAEAKDTLNKKTGRTLRLISYWFLGIGILSSGLAIAMLVYTLLGPSDHRANNVGITIGAFGTAFVNVLIGVGLGGVSRTN
jgi:hypothetical protein